MIIRVARARVAPGRREALEKFIRQEVVPSLLGQPGLLRLDVGRPPNPDGDGFVVITVWRDLPALEAFAGENWQEPKILPSDPELIRELVLEHYLSLEET